MSKLIMCKGLPGSGKSTWAANQVEQSYKDKNPMTPATHVVVNKDSIRRQLESTGWTWSPKNEKEVENIRDNNIKTFLKMNLTVISDDTNLAPKHEKQLRKLAMEACAEFEVKSFLHVPIETCIERDSKREGKARVGEKVILDMHNKYLGSFVMTPYEPDNSLSRAIICDLDGTLCIHKDRGPFDYDKCDTDLVNQPIWEILWAMYHKGYEVVYLSGREDTAKPKTLQWLHAHNCPGGSYPNLYMRPAKDFRKDSIVKYELFDNNVRNRWRVDFVLDDRNQVVEMWRKLGLTCLQVAPGDF
jgi:predicted kinase